MCIVINSAHLKLLSPFLTCSLVSLFHLRGLMGTNRNRNLRTTEKKEKKSAHILNFCNGSAEKIFSLLLFSPLILFFSTRFATHTGITTINKEILYVPQSLMKVEFTSV